MKKKLDAYLLLLPVGDKLKLMDSVRKDGWPSLAAWLNHVAKKQIRKNAK